MSNTRHDQKPVAPSSTGPIKKVVLTAGGWFRVPTKGPQK